jgi:hypothetical protein
VNAFRLFWNRPCFGVRNLLYTPPSPPSFHYEPATATATTTGGSPSGGNTAEPPPAKSLAPDLTIECPLYSPDAFQYQTYGQVWIPFARHRDVIESLLLICSCALMAHNRLGLGANHQLCNIIAITYCSIILIDHCHTRTHSCTIIAT